MTSVTAGGGGGLENWLILRTKSTDRLHEMRTKGGRGGLKSQKFADVINGSFIVLLTALRGNDRAAFEEGVLGSRRQLNIIHFRLRILIHQLWATLDRLVIITQENGVARRHA